MCFGSNRWHHWDSWSDDWRDDARERDAEVTTVGATGAGARRDPDLRVSQAERDDVAAALARHYADGRLTTGEYEERVAAALGATTGRDLEPLLVDLPSDRREARPAPAYGRAPARAGAPAGPNPRAVRVAAVVAVLVLAISTGPWALWLLWPALALTRSRYGQDACRPARQPSPPAVQRL